MGMPIALPFHFYGSGLTLTFPRSDTLLVTSSPNRIIMIQTREVSSSSPMTPLGVSSSDWSDSGQRNTGTRWRPARKSLPLIFPQAW